jgi:hypothetical protein
VRFCPERFYPFVDPRLGVGIIARQLESRPVVDGNFRELRVSLELANRFGKSFCVAGHELVHKMVRAGEFSYEGRRFASRRFLTDVCRTSEEKMSRKQRG